MAIVILLSYSVGLAFLLYTIVSIIMNLYILIIVVYILLHERHKGLTTCHINIQLDPFASKLLIWYINIFLSSWDYYNDEWMNQSVNQSINQSVIQCYQLINQSISQSISQSVSVIS